jgi:uncharacterized protein (DUF2267 family)
MKTTTLFLEHGESSLLNEIKKELALKTYQETVGIVSCVLNSFRRCLSLQYATLLLNRLPDFLKLVFVSNWKVNESQVKIDYLDELVSLALEQDTASGKKLFKSEIHALSTVVLTLKKLDKLVDLQHFEGISQSFRRQLREIPVEVAA